VAFKDLFNIFKNKDPAPMQYAKMMDGFSPIFSQFGNNIYANDVVQMCIDTIATELSKLRPTHIRVDNGNMQTTPNSSFNRLFKFAPNELMTTRDFIEKVIWLLMMNYNCFIYPMYDWVMDSRGNWSKNYTGFYPLNPTMVTFLQDSTGKLFVELSFANGDTSTLAYSEVIHLRKKFSMNDVMGGGSGGQPDNQALLKVLGINDTVLQGIGNAVKSSLAIRGILNINTMLDSDSQKREREKFEANLLNNSSGIVALDLKGEYIPLKPDPKLIDKPTLDFLQSKILDWYGVSMPILSGDFNDEQYQAFYEKTLEPIIISLGQAFSKTIFTQRELDFGNEIRFLQKDLSFLSIKSKIELIKIVGEQGLLSDNEKLSILGYAPIEGGDRITQSLNYVDKSLINSYQMNKSITGGSGNNG
jgi:HK97 family phage portal protein